jgi:hypothetical protein
MSIPAREVRSGALNADQTHYDLDPFDPIELDAGERICAPAERRGGALRALLVVGAVLGGAWWMLPADTDKLAWLGARVEQAASLLRAPSSVAIQSEPSSIGHASMMLPDPSADAAIVAIPDAPATTGSVAVEYPQTDEAPPSMEEGSTEGDALADPGAGSAELEPLPPPSIDPGDPYQKRAADAGLHPGLSRVLLARLTAADYRNARQAIDTAIARTGDTSEFIWPRQRKPEQALFRIHFVKGAASSCRRYVVTVVKDGWSTTAMPMERCGIEIKSAKGERRS